MSSDKKNKSGYKNPPKKSQFKKGQSGNPKGRPKKQPCNFESDVRDAWNEIIEVTKNGKLVSKTKRQVFLEQLVNGAIKRSPTEMRLAMPLLKMCDEIPEFEVNADDQAAFDGLLKKLNVGGSHEA